MGASRKNEEDQLYGLLTWHPRCKAGCHGDTHHEHVWAEDMGKGSDEATIIAAIIAGMQADYGIIVLACKRDPEALPPPYAEGRSLQGTMVGVQHLAPNVTALAVGEERVLNDGQKAMARSVPYLLTFHSPYQLNAIRKAIIADMPGAAETLVVASGDRVN